jgi:hypothetical protein
MSAPIFDEMIAAAEKLATEYLIDTKKSLPPTWYFFTDDGEVEVHVTAWHDDIEKEVMCAVLRKTLADPKYIAYAVISGTRKRQRAVMPRKLVPHKAEDFVHPSKMAGFKAWIASRPPEVRKLAAEFPIGTVITDNDGNDFYVIGWGETEDGRADTLLISPIWVGENYDMAMLMKHQCHAHHLRDEPRRVKRAIPRGQK